MTIRNHRVRWSRLLVDGSPKAFLLLEDLEALLESDAEHEDEVGETATAAALLYLRDSLHRVPESSGASVGSNVLGRDAGVEVVYVAPDVPRLP